MDGRKEVTQAGTGLEERWRVRAYRPGMQISSAILWTVLTGGCGAGSGTARVPGSSRVLRFDGPRNYLTDHGGQTIQNSSFLIVIGVGDGQGAVVNQQLYSNLRISSA